MVNPDLQRIEQLLLQQGYIGEANITMSVFLSMQLQKPLLIEGPAGVGKTEIAKVMARALNTRLIRLQCYEGLDATHAIYEWNYQRQLLFLKTQELGTKDEGRRTKVEGRGAGSSDELEETLFSEKYLMKRPLLEAITQTQSPVLLIDEIDRADEEFESFLLEILSDWQITIPEIGTITAKAIPYIVVTGNRTREISEALRRRCLYLYIDYPTFEKELSIVRNKVPNIDTHLGEQICRFMELLRQQKLDKIPGIAETLDWAKALAALHIDHLDKNIVEQTLGVILKDWQDIRHTQLSLTELWEKTGMINKM